MKVIKEGRRGDHVKIQDALFKPPESDDFSFAGSSPSKSAVFVKSNVLGIRRTAVLFANDPATMEVVRRQVCGICLWYQ